MDKNLMLKTVLKGFAAGIIGWLIYGLLFQALIEGEPVRDALFGTDSVIFGIVMVVLDTVLYLHQTFKSSGK